LGSFPAAIAHKDWRGATAILEEGDLIFSEEKTISFVAIACLDYASSLCAPVSNTKFAL
jgi:hypothetical protein